MLNHYHLALHVDEQQNEILSHEEVCERWCQLYSKPVFPQCQNALIASEVENKAALGVLNRFTANRVINVKKLRKNGDQHAT